MGQPGATAMSWGMLVPAFWGLVFAFFAVDGWRVSKGGSLICAMGAAIVLLSLLSACAHQPCTMREWATNPRCN